jgi:hypothetical protein
VYVSGTHKQYDAHINACVFLVMCRITGGPVVPVLQGGGRTAHHPPPCLLRPPPLPLVVRVGERAHERRHVLVQRGVDGGQLEVAVLRERAAVGQGTRGWGQRAIERVSWIREAHES